MRIGYVLSEAEWTHLSHYKFQGGEQIGSMRYVVGQFETEERCNIKKVITTIVLRHTTLLD